MSSQPPKVERKPLKSVEMVPGCMAIIVEPLVNDKEKLKIGRALFQDIKNENKMNFWNRELSDSILELTFLGWFEPDTLFVHGEEAQLAIIREAFARRVLKPPRNYIIKQLGDVEPIEFTPVPQSQFVPLTEVLCLIIAELNKRKVTATVEKIRSKLTDCYGDVKLPSEEILRKSFAHLIKEQKICHTGDGYFIVTPEDFLYLRECSEEATSLADAVSTTSPQTSPSVSGGDSRPTKNHKTGRYSVHGGVATNKGTQTRKDGPSPRSKSLPPSLSVREAQNGSGAPSRSRSVSLQRSNSLREKKGQTKGNFQRSGSMRAPSRTTGTQMSNVGSDSEASRVADNCGNAFGFGKLFRKSFGKKGKKIEDKREREREKDKDRDREKEKIDGKDKERKIVELHNYSAQFPPENMPQILLEMKQKASAVKSDKSGLNRIETNVKSSPKKDRVVISNTVEHIPGPSAPKEKKHKVYRKKDDADPLPESEAEFILPTKMYDDKCRTKAVSEQLRKQYSKKHKENPWKYLREKEGEALKKNGEKEVSTNGVASTRPKRSAKERPKSDPRDIRLRSIQHQRTAEYVSKLPSGGVDGKAGKHAENELFQDGVDSSEMTTSDNNRIMSHRARTSKTGLQSPRRAAADHDTIDSSDFTTEDGRERHVPRRYRAIKRDAAKIIRDIESRVDDSTDTFTSDQDDYVHHRHRPMSDTFMLASHLDNKDASTGIDTENNDDERDCTTPPLIVNHDLLDMPLPDDFQEPHNISVDSSDTQVPTSSQEYDEHPLRLSPIRESQESQLDRERASQQSLDSSKASKEAPKDYIEHDEAPTLSTDSTTSTIVRKEIKLSAKDSCHHPSESFSSSACDSGFNSPRGSIALSRHSNSPVEHMTYEQLREKRHSYCIPEGIELKDFEPQNVKTHVQKTKNGSVLEKERPSLIPKLKHTNNGGAPPVQNQPSKSGGSTPESTERKTTQLPKDSPQHKDIAQTRQHEALRVL